MKDPGNSLDWKTRAAYTFLLAAAIFASFGAGYRTRAQSEGQSGWLPPSLPASSLVRTADANGDGAGSLKPRGYKPNLKPYETLDEVRRAIKENFVKREVDETQLTYGAVRGMLRALNDRFTRFLTPEEYEEFTVKNIGEFTGIGARIDTIEEYHGSKEAKPDGASRPFIVEPIEGGPAVKAGLQKNDVILAIDGRNTADMSEDATVAYIRGVRGTPVKLKIERKLETKGSGNAKGTVDPAYKTFEVTLVRDVIEIHPVKLQWLPDGIAWLRLDEFNKKSDPEMTRALLEVQKGKDGKGPARGLILDMRGNPGGLLDVAVDICSRFVPSGPVVYTRERDGAERALNAESNRFLNLKMPIVVLINNYSASAAEIVTGALKDKHIATVVGEKSYGKASVQVLVELKNGGALVITTAKYLTPAKHDISEKGIQPDVVVKASTEDDQIGNGNGEQLKKAVALIREKNGATTSVALRTP
ncbi:MAG: S41 family peptidase [Armatimonadota bacterium]|nr:S41 family peptidase [Armatimonadota bacterium]